MRDAGSARRADAAGNVSLATPGWARTVLELDSARQPVQLGDWGDAWTDATGESVADKVATDARIDWQPTRQGAIYAMCTGKTLWFRFTVRRRRDTERWYLEVPYPSVNRVALFTPDSAGPMGIPDRPATPCRGGVAGAAPPPAAARCRCPPRSREQYLSARGEPAQLQRAAAFISESYLRRREQRHR